MEGVLVGGMKPYETLKTRDRIKVCTRCKRGLPVAMFHKWHNAKDGLKDWCKECMHEYNAQYRKTNLTARRQSEAAYRLSHRKELAHASAAYYIANREGQLQVRRRYAESHRQEAILRSRRWNAEHPERRRVQGRVQGRRRRARQREINEQFTAAMEAFVCVFWQHRCAVCGVEDRLEIDHWLPLTKGYALDTTNAVLLCRSCNARKSSRLPAQIYSAGFVSSVAERLQQQNAEWIRSKRAAV